MSSDETIAFEHYRVLRREDGRIWELGRGAMGVTYKAIDDNLHKVVALKVINALHVDKESSRDRFLREARAAASLNHRNVAGVYHLGQNAQSFFYAMEFIDGETVDALVKRAGPLPWRDALGIVIQVAHALMASHTQSLVHRDIKPDNIMLVPELGEDTALVKLIDFGLSKALLEETGSSIVTGSGVVGTPPYISPEQWNEETPDIRSDIYSLGATLWFMLVGAPPFKGTLAKLCKQHMEEPPPWGQLSASIPGSVRLILGRMLAKKREDRPQTPADLRRDLRVCLQQPSVPVVVPDDVLELLEEGILPADPAPAAEPYVLSAAQGNAEAQAALGVMYLRGRYDLPASESLALENFTLSAAQGNAAGRAYLGLMREFGLRTRKSISEATRLYELSAAQGDAAGQAYLGRIKTKDLGYIYWADPDPTENGCYSFNPSDGDLRTARALFEISAAQGNATGQVYLARDHADAGRLVKAAELYKLSAAQGNARAQVSLGSMHEEGRGVEKDSRKAIDFYRQAAAQGLASAGDRLRKLGEPLP